ncbi:MAG: helix-hairpin-helix domain-containing protein, partial [Pseudomonadota bacterium]|nr:helix-hairpin-helix domain-containing protein [Pseudomonadota bacterium]
DVPMKALDIAVKASKAAKAEYWACDIALGNDGKFRILECATAFAAFPYIRDWIGQYLMWLLSDGCFKKPTIPMFNWEELSKIDSSLLRIMRHIVFGSPLPSYGCEDVGDAFASAPKDQFAILPVELRAEEEWPSEVWNFQDNYQPRQIQPRMTDLQLQHEQAGLEDVEVQPEHSIDDARVEAFLVSLKGVGPTLVKCMIDTLGHAGIVDALVNDPARLQTVDRVGPKKAAFMAQQWQNQ